MLNSGQIGRVCRRQKMSFAIVMSVRMIAKISDTFRAEALKFCEIAYNCASRVSLF